ncbi:hypothetical protein M427DRAFT_72903 [Gonapodya prolifera JEL478]|uniref:F-box domain-containing protein n=1 Tax=Gonapodya prolifera (strain JEL478) TaxID=1344416 RepID=A0A139A3R1_GONPJ|nr:hypothetical protein M427DRAFT_72903 [Gonapodya prolifera JEL478]|eukprot:KXS11421.1 hypothetical protein M427DRAFT_72903 [Gonapodya prolifera JEL478]
MINPNATTRPPIPAELLAHIITLSSPSSLAAASLVSRSWNRAARTIIPTLGLKVRLKLHFLEPERSDSRASQRTDVSAVWLVGDQNTRFLPEFERGANVATASPPRVVLVAMAAEIIINCREFAALRMRDPSEARQILSDGIRTRVRPAGRLPTDGLNICFSGAMLQVMNNADENVTALSLEALPERSAALDKALNLCRLLQIHHIQFDRISYVLWSNSAPPFRGASLPSVTEVSFVNSNNQPHRGAGLWADDFEIASAMETFASQKLPFPNAKRFTTPYGELQVPPSNNFRFLNLSRTTVLHLLPPSVRQRTTSFVSSRINEDQFTVNSLLPNLEEFGTISLALGRMWSTSDHPSIAVLASLPATVHTVHATIPFAHLLYAASSLFDLFAYFSTLLPPPTRHLILTIAGAGPTQEDMRPTGRKFLRALVEISKRVVVEVRIEGGSGDVPVDDIRINWKRQLVGLEVAGVLSSGAVMIDWSKRHDNGFP